jgi:putative ABC transport system permease protein
MSIFLYEADVIFGKFYFLKYVMMSIPLQLRIALKNKLAYGISIFCLTIGFSVCLLVYRFLVAENSYDTTHQGYENIYRLTHYIKSAEGIIPGDATVQFPVANQLQSDYTQVESTSRLFRNNDFPLLRRENIKFVEENLLFADSNFFSFFAFTLIKGDAETALSQPNSIILTLKSASRYFGTEDPIGKTLIFGEKYPLTVTGIVDERKIQSHIGFDFLVPLSFQFGLWRAEGRSNDTEESWLHTAPWTYVRFKDAPTKTFIEKELVSFTSKHFPDAIKAIVTFDLQPISAIHTSSHFDTEIKPNTSTTYLKIFSFIIGAILLFSTFNFINLNASVLLNRAKEFSMKGLLGSSKVRLFGEVFFSVLNIAVVSLIVALGLSHLLQNNFNALMEVDLEPLSIADWPLILSAVGFILLLSLVASLQLILMLFSATSLAAAHSRKRVSDLVRKFIMGAQIACSFVLVFGTLVIFKQIGFISGFDLGFNKEGTITLPVRKSIIDNYESFKNEVKKIPSIKNVTFTTDVPGMGGVPAYRFVPEGFPLEKPMIIPFVQVDYDFIETMGIRMRDGREFDASLPGDTGQTYIVNEAFLESVNWKSEYIGKKLQMFKPGQQSIGYSGKIIGTFKNYHMESLLFPNKPLIVALRYRSGPWGHTGSILIKTETMNAETLAQIKTVWKNFENEWPFEYSLLDKDLDRLYKNESKLFVLTMILSMLTMLISFFGLFGINSVSLLKKYKPIAIKKVLGAHSGTICLDVLKTEFTFLALILLVAAPCGYFVVTNWLNEFQYRIKISYIEFFQAVALIVFLVFVTLLFHLFKMITTNPLKHIAKD